jgi:hypothetical protein
MYNVCLSGYKTQRLFVYALLTTPVYGGFSLCMLGRAGLQASTT